MLLPIKAICSASKVRKDGTSLVFIQYCKSESDKTLLNTEIAIPPQYWNKKLRRISDNLPVQYGIAKSLNEEIYRMYRVAEEIVKLALLMKLPDPVAYAKETFSPTLTLTALQRVNKPGEAPISLNFFIQLEDYINSKKTQVSPKMINVFNNLRDTLLAFQGFRGKSIEFEFINYNFYEELVNYLLNEHIQRRKKETIKGFKLSTAGKIIKQLRIFLKNRMRKKIIPFIDLTDFKILDAESDAIYLSMEEINKINDVDLFFYPHLQKYRDLFVLGCLTGLRFSDFSNIKEEDIRNDMLYKKQGKSDHWVVTLILYLHHFQTKQFDLISLLDLYHQHVRLDLQGQDADNHIFQSLLPFSEFVREYGYTNGVTLNMDMLKKLYKDYGVQ